MSPFRCRALALGCLVSLFGCSGAAPRSETPAEEASSVSLAAILPDGAIRLSAEGLRFIRTETAHLANDVSALHAPARIAYRDGSIAEVGTPVSGRVTELSVRLGDTVVVGDPLVTLRAPDAASTRAELSATRAALANAVAEARRTAEMLEHGVSTDRERRAADLRVAELEIELARAQSQVSILGRGTGATVVLRAPLAGTILSRRASIGMNVDAGSDEPLVEIGDPAALGVSADVFDRDAAMVRVGASALVTFPSLDAPVSGRVAAVAPIVTSGLRTVAVRIELADASDRLRQGLFGRAAITLVEAGIVLPSTAILIREGSRTIVYVEREPGTFVVRDVTVAPAADGRVYVASGVDVGDSVVVEGVLLLDGSADQLL
jgi:cobalt-zinc-cadmium efflux system membrane fusion protein